MLIGFKLKNFRSFLHEQSFTFTTTSDRSHESTHCISTGMTAVSRLSKAAVIFGANASGKSNFIAALHTLRELVLHSTAFSDQQFADRYTPFQFGSARAEPTEFEIDILLGQVRYRYSVSFDSQRICHERLLVYRTGKAQRWFERRFPTVLGEQWLPFSPSFNGPREMWRKATRSKALFLTSAAQLNSDQLKPLFHWFEHCLDIVLPLDPSDITRMATRLREPAFKRQILGLMQAVDIQVEDVRVAEPDSSTPEIGSARGGVAGPGNRAAGRPQIEFLYTHHGWSIWMDSEFAGAGAQRLFGLFGPLIGTIEENKLLVIDEFDANLHPLVSRFLLQLINSSAVPARSAQMLLVSHNTTLMDLDILRRDEIWLVELDGQRCSRLAPLLRSSPRKHELVAKSYLRGRYGAIPVLAKRAL
jgi:uncharacterized protein